MSTTKNRVNNQIRVRELRVIGAEGENFGVISIEEALSKARMAGLDLIEISPNAIPPVAKIMDYGKFQYAENKKVKAAKAKVHNSEVKEIQIKIGTGEHDLELKAKNISDWLSEGNIIRINLFLPGRSKYLDPKFLDERLNRILKFVTTDYKISQPAQKSPKGVSMTIEKK